MTKIQGKRKYRTSSDLRISGLPPPPAHGLQICVTSSQIRNTLIITVYLLRRTADTQNMLLYISSFPHCRFWACCKSIRLHIKVAIRNGFTTLQEDRQSSMAATNRWRRLATISDNDIKRLFFKSMCF